VTATSGPMPMAIH